MNVRSILRNLVFKLTPDAGMTLLLKSHYLRKLRAYSRHGNWEQIEHDMKIVKYLVKSGDSVIDVGANFGFYTVFLSNLVGTRGSVYSFEPIPLTFEILSHNIKRLSLVNVKAFNYALSEKDGSGVMVIPKWSASGGENFYQASIRAAITEEDRLRQIEISLKKLDSLLPRHEKNIAFIKIDVEGHEHQVILGATQVIDRCRPAMLVEISGNPDDPDTSAFRVVHFFDQRGYSPYWYNGAKLTRRSLGDKSVNYFFLTDEQFRDIQARMFHHEIRKR